VQAPPRKRRKLDPLTPPPPASEFPPYTPRDFFRFEIVHRYLGATGYLRLCQGLPVALFPSTCSPASVLGAHGCECTWPECCLHVASSAVAVTDQAWGPPVHSSMPPGQPAPSDARRPTTKSRHGSTQTCKQSRPAKARQIQGRDIIFSLFSFPFSCTKEMKKKLFLQLHPLPFTSSSTSLIPPSRRSSKSGAKVGRIHTPHGVIDTPGFVAVATNAALKAVDGTWADAGGRAPCRDPGAALASWPCSSVEASCSWQLALAVLLAQHCGVHASESSTSLA
jgi:hypothetical protein